MTRKEIVIAVTNQFVNMLVNDIIEENGTEPFVGWCEDGEVYRLNGLSEEDVEACMELSAKLGNVVDNFIFSELNPFEI